MVEQEVVVTTKHGTMPSFVVHPGGPGGPWPGIISRSCPRRPCA
jgi:hypothetical protein